MKATLVCIILAVVAVSAGTTFGIEDIKDFVTYVKFHGKHYDNIEEFMMRENLFYQRLQVIQEHNAKKSSYTLGATKFADMTDEEIKAFRGLNKRMTHGLRTVEAPVLPNNGAVPDSVDWRTIGVVTPVKNQGQCGSCWAFATTETVESAAALATGKLLVLSPQNVVDCTPNPNHCGGTGGCDGATAELGFTYVAGNGIATEANYPYKGVTGKCNTNVAKAAQVTGYVQLPENDYESLLNASAFIGPIAVSVDASTWSLYSKGVYDCPASVYKSPDIDHAVQLVGYGVDGTTPYWIVRNSWGTSWGEQGYIRLLRHTDGSTQWCGTDVTPSDGSGCDGGPKTVTVCGTCGIWYDSSYPTGATVL
jgi:cathepsin L